MLPRLPIRTECVLPSLRLPGEGERAGVREWPPTIIGGVSERVAAGEIEVVTSDDCQDRVAQRLCANGENRRGLVAVADRDGGDGCG